MSSRNIVLITGANGDIGYEAVKPSFSLWKPYHSFFGARCLEKAQFAVDDLKKEVPGSKDMTETLEIDLCNFNIAYIYGKWARRQCFNNAYDVNVVGTHVLIATFKPLLIRSQDLCQVFVKSLSAITEPLPILSNPAQPTSWPKKKQSSKQLNINARKQHLIC